MLFKFSSRVWAEAAIIDECAEEFSETDQMLEIAKEICGPYEWKEYDILIMPPSFPFGGMENPCLTFITPTLLVRLYFFLHCNFKIYILFSIECILGW